MSKSGGQLIFDEGKAEEARNMLFRMGRKRFGPPAEEVKSFLQSISA